MNEASQRIISSSEQTVLLACDSTNTNHLKATH